MAQYVNVVLIEQGRPIYSVGCIAWDSLIFSLSCVSFVRVPGCLSQCPWPSIIYMRMVLHCGYTDETVVGKWGFLRTQAMVGSQVVGDIISWNIFGLV